MGAGGRLKIANPLRTVPDAIAGTAAASVEAVAPVKPGPVAVDPVLSELWDQVVPDLDRAGLVCPSDALTIEMCLRHFAAARAASSELAKASASVEDRKHDRLMKHPAEVVFRSESLAFLEFAKQLGMTFVSRARTPSRRSGDGEQANPFLGQEAAGG